MFGLYVYMLMELVSRAGGSSIIALDDSDSRISYSPSTGVWAQATSTTLQLYDDTYHFSNLHSPDNANATIRLTFPHPSTAFMWRGFQRSDAGLFGICIDCNVDSPSTNFDVVDALNVTSTGNDPPIILWSTSELTNTVHNVTICNMLDPRVNKFGQITVDAFILQVDENLLPDPGLSFLSASTLTSTLTSMSTTSSTPAPSKSPAVTSTSTSMPVTSTTAPNPDNLATSTSKLSNGQVAGITVGAVLTLAILILALLLCLRLRSRKSVSTEGMTGMRDATPREREPLFSFNLFSPRGSKPMPFILPPAPFPQGGYPYRNPPVALTSSDGSTYRTSDEPPTSGYDVLPSSNHSRRPADTSILASLGIPTTRTSTSSRTAQTSYAPGLTNASTSTVAGSLMSTPRASVPLPPPRTVPTPSLRTDFLPTGSARREEDLGSVQGRLPNGDQLSSPGPPHYDNLSPLSKPRRSGKRVGGPRPLSKIPQSPGTSSR